MNRRNYFIETQGPKNAKYYVMKERLEDGSIRDCGFSSPSRKSVLKEIEACHEDDKMYEYNVSLLKKSKEDTKEFRESILKFSK